MEWVSVGGILTDETLKMSLDHAIIGTGCLHRSVFEAVVPSASLGSHEIDLNYSGFFFQVPHDCVISHYYVVLHIIPLHVGS